jgi:signal transduction histidine kinase
MMARRTTPGLRRTTRPRRMQAGRAVYLRPHVVSVAAHELNTPLAGLRASVQLMAQRLDRRVTVAPDQLHEALLVIEYEAERLARTVALVLDSIRLRAGDLRLHCTVVDLVPIIERRLALARAGTGRQLLFRQQSGSLFARVDPQRIEHLVGNLLENAMKYSPPDEPIAIELAADAGGARLSVTDRGLGIPSAERDSVFRPFYQVQPGMMSDGMIGLGLGLFVSREIVELHGGTIALEVPIRGGTRVVVTLPIDEPASD